MTNTYFGIGLSKHQLDLAVKGREEADRLPQDQESIKALCQDLDTMGVLTVSCRKRLGVW